jgi:antitoxin (DNA-binding transcriptional repressor) of toxin-antitoxin stability system
MKTITSKDLRNNMDKTLELVNAGEEIIVTHRFRKPVKLTLAEEKPKKGLNGLKAYEKVNKKIPEYLKNENLKELYSKDIRNKYAK